MITDTINEMRISRGWDKTDTPAILAKSIVIEAAELLECFQWDDDNFDLAAVKGELADVLMYTICMCLDLGLDYEKIIVEKFEDVKKRYPEI